MKRNNILSLLFLALLLCPLLMAQNDLHFYLNSAFRNNPTLKESQNTISVKKLDKSLTEAEYILPQINFTKSLFNGGVVDAYNNQTDLQIKSNEYNYELTKHNLEKDVTDQYINCWQAQIGRA